MKRHPDLLPPKIRAAREDFLEGSRSASEASEGRGGTERPLAADGRARDEFLLADPYPMSPSARQALRGAIRVLCPARPSFPDLEDRVELHVRRMLQYMPKAVAMGFSLAVLLVDWAPVWRFVAFGRLSALPRNRAERLLTEMSTSRWSVVRTMLVAVRGLVLSTFYDQDEVHDAMGYRPMPFLTERVQAREQLLAIAPKPNPSRSARALDGGALP